MSSLWYREDAFERNIISSSVPLRKVNLARRSHYNYLVDFENIDTVDSGIHESFGNHLNVSIDNMPDPGKAPLNLTEDNLRLFNSNNHAFDIPSKLSFGLKEKSDDYGQQFHNLLSACSDLSESGVFNEKEKEFLAVSVYEAFRKIVKSGLSSRGNTFFEGNLIKKSSLVKSWLERQYKMGLFKENVIHDLFEGYSPVYDELGNSPSSISGRERFQRFSQPAQDFNYDVTDMENSSSCKENVNVERTFLGNNKSLASDDTRREMLFDSPRHSDDSDGYDSFRNDLMNSNTPEPSQAQMREKWSSSSMNPLACSSVFRGTPHYLKKLSFSPAVVQSPIWPSNLNGATSQRDHLSSSKRVSQKGRTKRQVATPSNNIDGSISQNTSESADNQLKKLELLQPVRILKKKSETSKKSLKRKRPNQIESELNASSLDTTITRSGRNVRSPLDYWSSKNV